MRVPNPRTTQEDYAAAKMKIKKWTELASDDGLDALNPRDLPENMRELAKAKQAAASTIEDGLRLQAEATCEDLDKIIELKKYKEQENYQILRAFIDGDITPRAEDMSDPLTSSLEKKRTRIMNEFHQAIKKQQELLGEIARYQEENIDPEIKALKILSCLAGNDIDPNVNQAIDKIEPETALFLSLIIDDVMSKTERNKLISRIRQHL